uniref:Cytochrome b-c1 complex subunit 2, mitochondrial-like n=1 Tax=Phallusia mammillata TaxID=59560 RepID=A0A6F9DWW1_9ASCI|nr:cytochrome b-c1 complex subunit 2, mitochondrial-like [Phallusia mammillata]
MLRSLQVRQQLVKFSQQCYTTQAVAATSGSSTKLSVLPSGLRVASTNENAPVAQLALLVNSGSRDESQSNLGITHCLQCTAGLTGSRNTAFLTTQLLSSLGADLQVTAGREHTLYSVRCNPHDAQKVFTDVVAPTILGAKFPWYEINDVTSRMKYQKAVATSDPCFTLMETAHKASFKGSLSNSVMSPDFMIGHHTSEMLQAKFNASYNLSNMVLSGSGVSHDGLIDIGSACNGAEGSATQRAASQFIGGEVHVGDPTPLVHAALTFEGVALNDKDAVALSVLQYALGVTGNIRRGSGLNHGSLNPAVEKSTDGVFSTNAFSVNYSDTGLFGIYVVSPQESINAVLQAVSAECKKVASNGLSDAAVNGAKERFKAAVLMNAECMSKTVQDMAVQSSVLGTIASPSSIVALIDGVSAADVAGVARRVLTGKRGLATVGRGSDGPFLRDL